MMRVLVCYSHFSSYVNTTREYLESFKKLPDSEVYYINVAKSEKDSFYLEYFDVVILSYCARLCIPDYLSNKFIRQLSEFRGVKMVCIQDEYDQVDCEVRQLKRIGVDSILTCVPEKYWRYVYSIKHLPEVNFRQVLTGYVSESLPLRSHLVAHEKRKTVIGYRGRKLSEKYGELGWLKFDIGVQVKKRAKEKGLKNIDIEWSEQKRIYGSRWGQWLKSIRCTLVTESGSNVFDFDGSIGEAVDTANKTGRELSNSVKQLIARREAEVKMNQISPRVFEAISHGCCLIAFEGEYSNILVPGRHYISLKKDYSNLEQVLELAQDASYTQKVFEASYNDIILPRKNTYDGFIDIVYEEIERVPRGKLKSTENTVDELGDEFSRGPRVYVDAPCRNPLLVSLVLRPLGVFRAYFIKLLTYYIFHPKKLLQKMTEKYRRLLA